jgi:hypothetical protein
MNTIHLSQLKLLNDRLNSLGRNHAILAKALNLDLEASGSDIWLGLIQVQHEV